MLLHLGSLEVCLERCQFFKKEGVVPMDYRERIIELSNNKFILAGIRFYGLDILKPFISIQLGSCDLIEKPFLEIIEKVLNEFSLFQPRFIHLKLPINININIDIPLMKIDQYTLVGDIDEVLTKNLDLRPEKIELIELSHLDFYDSYKKEYDLFHQRSPSLLHVVKAECLEDFEEALSNQLLYRININDTFAGIIAGVPRDYYGFKGVCILEEILFDKFIGKGFGAYVQKAFIKKLQNRYKVVWGTISSSNISSLKTALKNGREITEVEYLFSV